MSHVDVKPLKLCLWAVISALLAALQSGCAQTPAIPVTPAAPMPENVVLDHNYQKQVQASSHWQVVAEDMATQLLKTIQDKKLNGRPFYIYAQTKPTTFTRAFNDFLITTLVNKGVRVSNEKAGSRVFNYKIQLVEYNTVRSTMVSENFKFTALGAGLVVVRNLGDWLGVDGAVLATGAALDTMDMNIAPNLEMIITTSVMDGPIFLSRTTDIYYANQRDRHLYVPALQNKASDVFNEPFYQMK